MSRILRVSESKWATLVLLIAIGVHVVYFGVYQIQRYRALWTYGDLANMEQTIWNTLHGDFMRATVYPPTGETVGNFNNRLTESRFSSHVQPILLVLAIPYALISSPITLLLMMVVVSSLGAVSVQQIAERRLYSSWWALLFSVGFLLLPVVQTHVAWDFHGTNLVPALLLAAINAAELDKRGWWWLWCLLAMGCREDMPFLTGWAMIWLVPASRRRESWLMFGLGLLLSLLNFFVIIPHYAGAGTPYITYLLPPGTDSSSISEIWRLITNIGFWKGIGSRLLAYNMRLGWPFLFFYVLHLPSLLAMAPVLVLNGISTHLLVMHPTISHHSAFLVPSLMVGAVEGFLVIERSLSKKFPKANWRIILSEILFVLFFASQYWSGYMPIAKGFLWPSKTGREDAVTTLLDQTPSTAPISVDSHLAARVAKRSTYRIFPDLRDVEWAVIDVWFGRNTYGTNNQFIHNMLMTGGWRTIAAMEGIVVLRRDPAAMPQNVQAAFLPSENVPLRRLTAWFESPSGERLYMIGADVFERPLGKAYVCTEWYTKDGWDVIDWTPRVSIRPSGGKILYTQALDAFEIYPDMFVANSVVRDCTGLATITGGDSVSYEFVVATSTSDLLSVQLTDVGDWESDVTLNEGVVLSVPAWW